MRDRGDGRTIDAELLSLLLAEREKYLRILAGVPDGAPVDLSLVKLSGDALMFPNPTSSGESFPFTKLRNPRNTTKEFVRKATILGFAGLRFHDLRGTHETLLLKRGTPIHEVAARSLGQLLEQGAVKTAGIAIVDVFDAGLLAQFGDAQPCREALVLSP